MNTTATQGALTGRAANRFKTQWGRLLLLLACALAAHSARAENKTFVSEIARNNVAVTIVISGEALRPAAKSFQASVIAANPKRKSLENVLIAPLKTFTGRAPLGMTYLFFLQGNEITEEFTPAVKAALPVDLATPRSTLGVLRSVITSDAKGAGAFSIVIYAPDAARWNSVFNDFKERSFGNDFRAMGRVERIIETNKIKVFSTPALRPDISGWGARKTVGTREFDNTIEWHDLADRAKMTPDDLIEWDEAYFFDRSETAALPGPVAAQLKDVQIAPTSIVSTRVVTPGGREVAVFSAPDRRLLGARADRFPDLAALPEGPQLDAAVDMRSIGRTVLLVNGSAPREDRATVRLLLAKDMRRTLGLSIDERGRDFFRTLEDEDTLRTWLGDSQARASAQREVRSQWIWLFTLVDYSGQTTYDHSETCTTPEFPEFSQSRPSKPSVKGKGEDEKNRDNRRYDDDVRRWELDRDLYNIRIARADREWKRTLSRHETANVRGVLRLVNLADKGRVAWEHEASGQHSYSVVIANDTVSVRGREGRPSSMVAPEARRDCTLDVMKEAARYAGQKAIEALHNTAWLPAPGAPDTVTDSDDTTVFPPDTAMAPPKAKPIRIAEILGAKAFLTIALGDVRAGDLFTVALETREIRDPDTKEVLETLVLDSLTLRVAGGTTLAQCVAATPADAAKWAKLKIGQTVTRTADK